MMAVSYSDTEEHKALEQWGREKKCVLSDLLKDSKRNCDLTLEFDHIVYDATRELLSTEILNGLCSLASKTGLLEKVSQLNNGDKINQTEKRAVLHIALRADQKRAIYVDNQDVVKEVHSVLGKIKQFSESVRNGEKVGYSGKKLCNTVCIGIGGSYLGVEFVHESFRTQSECAKAAEKRTLRFLANVDPIDTVRALENLDPETTLVIIVSKTFTTAETILNAKAVREWILKKFGTSEAIAKHFCAVSTNLEGTKNFGIIDENVFGFWDWVGGRFSVCSAVGVLPLALQYGYKHVEQFLKGANSIDKHFVEEKNMKKNLPIMMALISIWNSTYLGYNTVAILPYCQALCKFPAHIQQLTMESNGKGVCLEGKRVDTGRTGEIYFGEPGTNGQHSFYQLIHQGRVVPCEFIGFAKSQQPRKVEGCAISCHDELMSNFFAQPDALALGKSAETLSKEGCPKDLIPHKTFEGNRPSSSLLFLDELNPYRTGQLLALYEHRTVVQGFIWNINSFDQWGVELGKVLAKKVGGILQTRQVPREDDDIPQPSKLLLTKYLNCA